MFHLIAVLLLFLAGVDIGWNQVDYSNVIIYRELNNTLIPLSKRISSILASCRRRKSEEEFISTEAEEDYVPNIDPVFHVDFDKLTEGGGVLNTLARCAIYIHRLLLQIFYYLPISILTTMTTTPHQLLMTPLILCIISLVVWQTAKLIFGAKLPEQASDKKDSKDVVLAMMKQGVVSFLAGMFPTVVSVYDIWTHLHSDMYVILCGVFVGLAYTHHIADNVIVSDAEVISETRTDEL